MESTVGADGQPLPAAWADELIERAEGKFLYVFHYCRALRFGAYHDLRELPKPADYYPAFLAHLEIVRGVEGRGLGYFEYGGAHRDGH